jgi:glutaredoxin 2
MGMKPVIKWIVEHLIWPLLKYLGRVLFEEIGKYIFNKMKYLLNKWKKRDMDEAKTDAEKDHRKQKWEERIYDFDKVYQDFQNEIPKVLDEIFKRAEKEKGRLLESPKDNNFKKIE